MADSNKKVRARRNFTRKELVQMAVKFGATAAKVVSPKMVKTGPWVAWKCQFGCGSFGSSLVCPPHTPAPSKTRRMLDEYKVAVLFECRDGKTKRVAAMMERELFLAGCFKAFGFGSGPCELCEVCAFDKGCRHPHQARPAMEACGVDVFSTARRNGFKIEVVRSPCDRQHYFGLVLVK
ncbi:MAG: DUF2284 domain-containing protein [Phycisphaerae bacterium]|nr:DUF2284 domain-containing protein [Phycisphaerae bacterium]